MKMQCRMLLLTNERGMNMKTYKLFRKKNGKLYPLFVNANKETPIGEWIDAEVGDKKDETHVKSRLGSLSLRPGWHSTEIPFTDWIGERQSDGSLAQRKGTIWCECEVEGEQLQVTSRYGSRELLNGWYYFRTNSKQIDPWIISNKIKVTRILSNEEVTEICRANGKEPQKIAE